LSSIYERQVKVHLVGTPEKERREAQAAVGLVLHTNVEEEFVSNAPQLIATLRAEKKARAEAAWWSAVCAVAEKLLVIIEDLQRQR
jgi:hypothetical protein